MLMNAYLPSEALRPYIKSYVEIESAGEIVNRVLPGTSLALAIRYKGQVNYLAGQDTKVALPTSAFSGLRKSVRLINYLPNTAVVIVLFKENNASAFFKAPLHELFEESVSAESFITPSVLANLEEQVAAALTSKQRIAVIEQFLLSRLQYHQPDVLITAALQKIYLNKGNLNIKQLAGSLCISHDALEKRFRKTVGTSPKQFAGIVRLKAMVHQKKPGPSLTALALDAGYFDQAHFNKDFKLFTGQTPTDFFKSPLFW